MTDGEREIIETVIRVGQKLADRLITIIEQQEKTMSTVSDALAASVATNASLAAAVVALAQNQGTPDTVLQPILDQVNTTNAAMQAALPPAPPPAG